MNLAIRGIDGNLGLEPADSFHSDLHKDLKADYVLANPPFNVSDWGGDACAKTSAGNSARRPPATPTTPGSSTSSHHLAPQRHRRLRPRQRLHVLQPVRRRRNPQGHRSKPTSWTAWSPCPASSSTTQIPVCLWFLTKNKAARGHRDRRGEILFIDARKLGHMVSRIHKEFSDEDIRQVANTYHAWRGQREAGEYKDVKGFCKAATLEEVRDHEYILTPGRYVGIEDTTEDGEPFAEKMTRLTGELADQFAKSQHLEERDPPQSEKNRL